MIMNERHISEKEMLHCIDLLELTLRKADFSHIDKICFFDVDGLLHYMTDVTDCHDIWYIYNKLEPFIPITVEDDKADILLQAITSDNDRTVMTLEKQLKSASTIEFLKSLCVMEQADNWAYMKELFIDIRKYMISKKP